MNYAWKGHRMNRVVFALVTILFLLSVSSIAGLIQVVKAEGGTVTINADGSITPSTAPIYTADNITYTLTGNIINESIVVERDSIMVDGAGYTVQGTGSGTGITLSESNLTIQNTKITKFDCAIWLNSSSNSSISGNNITANNWYGILLDSSSNCSISGNNITNNTYGIYLDSSLNCSISGNNITNNTYGIYLDSSSNYNSISGNNITNNENGIWLDSSSNNTLYGNNVTANNYYGIFLIFSSNNTLSSNNITANDYGIRFDSSNNFIFLNNFANNTNQVSIDGTVNTGVANTWDNGGIGNYWSDYLTKYPNAIENDSSGVWNTPYVIDANNTDYYPLTVPYAVVPEFPSFLILPLFLIATLLAVLIYKKKAMPYKRL
jgi:parallel beta-helix repeat protein